MISTARIFGVIVALALLLGQPAGAALAQAAPYCAPGTSPQFSGGFASLKASLGDTMGDPLECEHQDGSSGDTLQQTTTGLAFWRKSTNTWSKVSTRIIPSRGYSMSMMTNTVAARMQAKPTV